MRVTNAVFPITHICAYIMHKNFIGPLEKNSVLQNDAVYLQVMAVNLIQSFPTFCSHSSVYFSTLGLGPGPLELGKLATKLEFWENSHFNNHLDWNFV